MLGTFSNLLNGGGGYSASQHASQGANYSSGAVNVGGFNPPALGSNNTLLIVGAVVIAWLALRKA